MNNPSTIHSVAVEFSRILHSWLSDDEMNSVIERNKSGASWCASHDFCDANEAMLEALDKCGISVLMDQDNDIWNRAWSLAKKNHFFWPAS